MRVGCEPRYLTQPWRLTWTEGSTVQQRITRRELLKAGLVTGIAVGVGGVGQWWGVQQVATQLRRSGDLPWEDARRIVAETTIPTFPDYTIRIASGEANYTAILATTIRDCSSRGGGHVVVPAGVYPTGAIELLSNVNLHLEAGAVLRFNGRASDYPLVRTRYEGIECVNRSPMVYAYGQTNIALTGSGTLDASGTRTWNTGSDRATVLEPLVAAGISPEQRVVPQKGRLRSTFVEPYRCADVLIQGVTLRQSQFWQLHPTLCRNVTIDSVTTGDAAGLNGDGCNPESCDHVVIKNCTLDASDDCIGIKSGRDADGRRVNAPCENVVISGCKFQSPAGAIAIGSEMSGGIRNVYAFDLETFGESVQHLLYVKSNTRRGGYATNLNLDSVQADYLRGAWAFAQMDYDGQTGSFLPRFEDWTIRNAVGDWAPCVLQLSGLAGDPIRRVNLVRSRFTHVLFPLDLNSHVDGIAFDGVAID